MDNIKCILDCINNKNFSFDMNWSNIIIRKILKSVQNKRISQNTINITNEMNQL